MATKQPSSKAAGLGEAKLNSSGIDVASLKKLGLQILDGAATQKLHKAFKPLCSLKLNYHDHLGKPLSDWAQGKPFYRIRYLELPTDFQALTDKKPVRYVQEPTTSPAAYYPLNQDWTTLVNDAEQPLILTEGELKAIKACQEGFPTIGLGGVYSWRSHKLGIEWLPSLDPIKWVRRNVYIVFDSDYRTNIMVCSALQELAYELHRRGAFVQLVSLPQLPGSDKVGLDDFLVRASPDELKKLLHEAEPLGLARVLFNYNDKYVYIQDPGLIVNQATRAKITPSAFKDHLESTTEYQERELKKDGAISYKAVAASAAWLRWPLRREANKLTYQPGQARFIEHSPIMFNIWPGWGVQPKKGDATPFLKLLEHLFTGAEPEALIWFRRWCAYPLQNPGTKMFSSVLLHGRLHGTGKSFVGYTLGKIYGENFTEIDQQDLHASFNDWAEAKQFIMADDITGSNKRSDADILKKRITQQKLRINAKYVPSYTVPDCINYFFTANQPDAFFLEDDDRRHFIHQVIVAPLPEEFYVEYELWLQTGGAEAVFDYLLKLDLGDFNPAAPAFRTAAKERMTAVVQSDLAQWVRQLQSNPDHVLKLGEAPITKDLFTSKELLSLYDPLGRGNTTANGVARELARAGVEQVVSGRPLRLADGSQARYYATRNVEKWMRAVAGECISHLNNWNVKQAGTAKKY
jgi:hypothetical protein